MNFKVFSRMSVLGFVCLALCAGRPAKAESVATLVTADRLAYAAIDDPLDGAFAAEPSDAVLIYADPLAAEAPPYEGNEFGGLSAGALSGGEVDVWREALANEDDERETLADAVPEPTAAVLLFAMLSLLAAMTLLRSRFDQMSTVPVENPANWRNLTRR